MDYAAARLGILKDSWLGPSNEFSLASFVSLYGEIGNLASEYARVATVKEPAACAVNVPVLMLP